MNYAPPGAMGSLRRLGLGAHEGTPPLPKRPAQLQKTEQGYRLALPVLPLVVVGGSLLALFMARKNPAAMVIVGSVLGYAAYSTTRSAITHGVEVTG